MSQENTRDPCASSSIRDNVCPHEVAELAPVARLIRSGTIRRASTISGRKERETSITVEDYDDLLLQQERDKEKDKDRGDKPTRRSLDSSSYRRSLESISEYRTKSSFSISLNPSRSEDSSSSDCTDYALRSTTSASEEKTFQSPSSSYLSWIESVNSEYFGSAQSSAEIVDVDNKVGEWNNFWLNYSSARGKYLSSQHLCASTEERTTDDLSDAKSTASTQKDFTEKNSTELIVLTLDEIGEVLRLSQRVTEILQHAIRRSDPETDESYYSQALSQHRNSLKDDFRKDRSLSFVRDNSQDPVQVQKQLSKAAPPSTGGSCINALFTNGVTDILKRVIAKRKDFIGSDEPSQSPPRGSFSERPVGK